MAQFGYDAYGSVVTAESLFAHALLRAGHKGLFFDRLDLGVADPLSLEESPRLAVGADLLGNARNRVYSPRLGRWVQRDPNASGQGLVSAAMHGEALWADAANFDLGTHYRDGASVHEYISSHAWNGEDPLGLSTAWLAPLAPGIGLRILANSLMGALVGGTMDAMTGGDFFGVGMASGAIGGGFGGAAFGASASGLFGSLAARLGYAGAWGGFAAGSMDTAMRGGTLAQSLADGLFSGMVGGVLGYGGGSVAGYLGRWGADDTVLAGAGAIRRGYGIDYAGVRGGYRAQTMWEKMALEQVARSGGGKAIIEKVMGDPVLQSLAPGTWTKWQVIRVHPSGGFKLTIHYSKHSTGLIDDVKITNRNGP